MTVIGPSLRREPDCEAVLRTLPEWFGIETALLMYARDSGRLPTFAVEESSAVIGFVTLREHFVESWEVHCIAVAAERRNEGIGSRLLTHAERWLLGKGVRFLQVKTVAASSGDRNYGETREFYSRRGFTPIEVFATLWSPKNPALQLIKPLGGS